MPAQKRTLDESSVPRKSKKPKVTDAGPSAAPQRVVADEIDFPRGGGTSFTPLEFKTIRAEAVKEANEELFEVCLPVQNDRIYISYILDLGQVFKKGKERKDRKPENKCKTRNR